MGADNPAPPVTSTVGLTIWLNVNLIAPQQAKLARLLDEGEALARGAWALLCRGAQREAPREPARAAALVSGTC